MSQIPSPQVEQSSGQKAASSSKSQVPSPQYDDDAHSPQSAAQLEQSSSKSQVPSPQIGGGPSIVTWNGPPTPSRAMTATSMSLPGSEVKLTTPSSAAQPTVGPRQTLPSASATSTSRGNEPATVTVYGPSPGAVQVKSAPGPETPQAPTVDAPSVVPAATIGTLLPR